MILVLLTGEFAHCVHPSPSLGVLQLVERVCVVVWQLSCRGSYNLLKRDYVADAVPLYQYTHWNWYSFCRPRKDNRLSQPPGVLIQRPTRLELRTLGSQATTLTTEPKPGSSAEGGGLLTEESEVKARLAGYFEHLY